MNYPQTPRTKENTVENLLTTEQVANITGLAHVTLRRWRSEGVGPPFVKLGRIIRYRRADVMAFIDDRVRVGIHQPAAPQPESGA